MNLPMHRREFRLKTLDESYRLSPAIFARRIRLAPKLRKILIAVTLLGVPGFLFGAEVDESKLPPPADTKVDFDAHIKPIFESSCFRCHGPERPKSHFRLDNRESALKGGEDGVDIIPGQSAKSPLIHYVARLVEDMEMPPKGKGDPLTKEQIGLLRAWIDQGANWSQSSSNIQSTVRFSITPTLRWITVDGNKQQFREHYWMNDGWVGGFQEFSMQQQISPETKATTEGKVFLNGHDYELKTSIEKQDFGFARFGFEQYRRYYNDVGGFYEPFSTNAFSLDQNLNVDIGRVWFDFGLTIPKWPRMTLGYEYQYKDGVKSTLQWGDVFDSVGTGVAIYPALKDIDEHTHIIKFDASYDWRGILVEDNFRGEFYDLSTKRTDTTVFSLGGTAPESVSVIGEKDDHFQAVNTVHAEKQLKDWLFVSGGYLYSKLDGNASFGMESFAPLDPVNSLFTGEVSDQILLDRQSHVFNLNTSLGPWQGLSLTAGVQSDWTRERGLGESFLPGFPDPYPKIYSSDKDQAGVEEDVGLRYTQIPFTVLYAEGRFQQVGIDHFEHQFIDDDFSDSQDFLRDTDDHLDRKEVRTGFTISPWRRVSLNASYRHGIRKTDYSDQVDSDGSDFPGNGYPAFIRSRTIEDDEVEAKLVVHWVNWLKTTLKYQIVATDYTTVTDPSTITSFDPITLMPLTVPYPGGSIFAGNYDAHVYSLSTTLTPWKRLYLSTTFSYSDSRTVTGVNGDAGVAPYKGDIYTVLCSANYALNNKTDWNITYAYSRSDYRQDLDETPLPLGIAYDRHGVITGITRRFKKNITTGLQYGFFKYNEPTSGGFNDYTAHAIFATIGIVLN